MVASNVLPVIIYVLAMELHMPGDIWHYVLHHIQFMQDATQGLALPRCELKHVLELGNWLWWGSGKNIHHYTEPLIEESPVNL